MPKAISTNKYTPQVEFSKQLDRDLDKVYGGIQMGETEFYYDLLNKVKPKPKGIHHFTESIVAQRKTFSKVALNASQDQRELDKWALLKSQVKKDKKKAGAPAKGQEK